MMKRKLKLSLIAAALVAAGAARAGDYVTSSTGPLRTAFGGCVRTGYWSADGGDCDPKPVIAQARPERQAQPEPMKVTLARQHMVAAQVFFPFDGAQLGEEARRSLDALVETLGRDGVERGVAVGHADPIGSDPYNDRLSQRRAEAVRGYLIEKGLPAEALVVEAKGRQQPVTSGCEAMIDRKNPAKVIACLQPDRRVEIEVFAVERPVRQTAEAAAGTN